MKKILFLLISVFMVFGLVACGDENENEISFSWWEPATATKQLMKRLNYLNRNTPNTPLRLTNQPGPVMIPPFGID